MSPEVRVFKMLAGPDIVATVQDESGIVREPMYMIIQQHGNNQSITLAPVMNHSDQKEQFGMLNIGLCVLVYPAAKKLADGYNAEVEKMRVGRSGLILPSSSIPNLGPINS